MMNPRERVKAAMQLEPPDRVPLMCQFSWGFMNLQLKENGLSPMAFWFDAEQYARGLMILRDRFLFDGILVSVHGHSENWFQKIQNLEIRNGIEIAHFGNYSQTFVEDDLPLGTYSDKVVQTIETINPDDIPEELDYIPASKDCIIYIDHSDPYRVFDILRKETEGAYSIHGEVTSPLDYLLDLLGYENALTAMVLHEDKVNRILEKFTQGVIRMAEGMAQHTPIDAIKISSPFAGSGFISPEYYKKFEAPFLAKIADAIAKTGRLSYVHTCGHINDRLEEMSRTGVNGLECLDPPPMGDVELADAFERIGRRIFIKGNIDSVHTLLKGDQEAIKKDVIKRLRIGMQHPGFILSTACSIAPGVPAEKVRLLHTVVEEFGYYHK
jgi:hypothetical protein